jgi:hypothetical protein
LATWSISSWPHDQNPGSKTQNPGWQKLPSQQASLPRKFFKAGFSGSKPEIFPAGGREAKTSQTLALKNRLQKYFKTPGRKSPRLSRPFPTTLARSL